jgi:hypothetical protein
MYFGFQVGFRCPGFVDPGGFSWVFLCGLAELFLCIVPLYLGASYAFFNKIFLLIKKKKKRSKVVQNICS